MQTQPELVRLGHAHLQQREPVVSFPYRPENENNGMSLCLQMAAEGKVLHSGGCHCGAVRFQVLAPPQLDVIHCNCSICIKKQNHHFIVPQADFTLLKGEEFLTCYTFNTHQAKHTFCKICGVQSFYTPRSNPDGRGIAPHCLDKGTAQTVNVTSFDGSNWEKAFDKDPSIRDRSKT